MKATKWLIIVLMLALAVLIFVRRPAIQGDSKESTAQASRSGDGEEGSPSFAERFKASGRGGAGTGADGEAMEGANRLTVIVQDKAGQPLEAASVRTAYRAEGRRPTLTNYSRSFSSDRKGIATVLWPEAPFVQFEIVVSKDDFAARKMIWDLPSGDKIPASYTVKLDAGVKIGGVVVDPEGNPIADATIRLSRFWYGGEERKLQGEDVGFSTHKETTGPDGRWSAHSLPPEVLDHIGIEATHSNFIGSYVQMYQKPEVERQLREGTHRIQLTRGLAARGRVVNEQQQPIAGAKVWAGRRFTRERKESTADEQGRFEFANIQAGKVDFSASADGYAPGAKTHTISTGATDEVVLQLSKGSVIRGVVRDNAGLPIEDVRVVLEGSPGEASYDRFEFSTKTDANGNFEWRSAPDEPMPFYFGKLGYQQKRGVRLKPATDNVITLRGSRQISGQVLDADTEQPITRFTIAVGRSFIADRFSGSSSSGRTFSHSNGLFTVESDEENENALQATAKGYSEKMHLLARTNETNVVIRMKPSLTLTGLVVNAEGQPVVGAAVAVAEVNRYTQLTGGQLRNTPGSRNKLVTTDEAGKFVLESPPETGTVIATHTNGYGSVPIAELKTSGVLKLESFGRIEGVLMAAGVATEGQEVLLTSTTSGASFDFTTTKQATDAQGKFAFENVPPGAVNLVRLVRLSSRSGWAHSHRTEVIVKPGETTHVVLGGRDATLHARVRFETAPTDSDYFIRAQLNTARPEVPSHLTTAQERSDYMKSPEYREQLKKMNYYAAEARPDGSLAFDAIPPGQYTLRVSADKQGDTPATSRSFASGEVTVTVPPGADPTSPIQIGDVVLKPPQPRNPPRAEK